MYTPLTRNSRQSAFTLIELLVVIAIIAILASILFPVFGRARENARRSTCQSNLKQLGLAIQQYTQDYDEKLPSHNYLSGINGFTSTLPLKTGTGVATWDTVIFPYSKSAQLLKCPSDTVSKQDGVNYGNLSVGAPGYARDQIRSYSYPTYVSNVSLALVAAPTLTVQLLERNNTTYGNDYWYYCAEAPTTKGNVALTPSGELRHLGTSNFLYVDGHVKALPGTNDALALTGHPFIAPSYGTYINSAADLPK